MWGRYFLLLLTLGVCVGGRYERPSVKITLNRGPYEHKDYNPSQKEPVSTRPFCPTRNVVCSAREHYPDYDGSCNNKEHPLWGATDTTHVRLLPVDYGDGKGTLRESKHNRKLPSARAVSNALRETRKEMSSSVSHLHVLWGQLLAHDLSRTPLTRNPDGTMLDCECGRPHRECKNIELPGGDEQLEEKSCLRFARSKRATGIKGCEFSHREQINDCSSVIDATMVYGKTSKEGRALRDYASKSGLLLTKSNPLAGHPDMMPTQNQISDRKFAWSMDCPRMVHKPVDVPCFVAGDVRANENTGLAAMQTVWVRYHNKIARSLKHTNPHWDGEKVFNEARMIVIALVQIITYREYLPALIGPDYMKRFGLNLETTGYWNGYDPKVNPTVANSFATAAFRYGHSQLAEKLTSRDVVFDKVGRNDLTLGDSFFNTEPLLKHYGQGVGGFMRGFMHDRAEKMDSAIVDDFRNKLFKEFGKKFGGDLLSLNIQRGRDHGLPGYNAYREVCGLERAYSFHDLHREIPEETLAKLESVYWSVDDIDLYAGGISERSVDGGQLGPTFACIVAYQFRALRRGDRYWHENEHSPSAFSFMQLAALRRASFTSVLCDVSEYMTDVMKDPLLNAPDKKANCDHDVIKLDLDPWKNAETPRKMSYGPRFQVLEWTRRFVIIESYDATAILAKQLSMEHPDEICKDVVDTRTRHLAGEYKLVSFGCRPGTIRATDFPYELSEHTYWTEWKMAKPLRHDAGYELGVEDFYCDHPVAIQAQAYPDGKFARETEDVFEEYNIKNGFLCRHFQQIYGRCNEYKVRILCARPTYEMAYKSYTNDYRNPELGKFEDHHVPANAPRQEKVKAQSYCSKFGVCCDFKAYAFKKMAIPPHVWKYAAPMCDKYHMCCEKQFDWW